MSKRAWYISSIIWIALCIAFFWAKHFNGGEGFMFSYLYNIGHILSPLRILWLILIILGGVLSIFFSYKKAPVIFSYRPWWLALGFFFLLFLVFIPLMSGVWDVQIPYSSADSLRKMLLQEFGKTDTLLLTPLSQGLSFAQKSLWGLCSLLFLFFSSIGFGALFKKVLPKGTGFHVPLMTGLGLVMIMGILFLMGVTGILSLSIAGVPLAGVFLALGLLLGVLFAKEEYALLIWKKNEIKITGAFSFLAWVLWAVLFLSLATTFVHLIRPIPIGWDDISLYMNLPKLTSEHGLLVAGQGSYNWGLIMSLGFVIFNTPYVAMLFSAMGGVLALWMVYHCVKAFDTTENTILPLVMTSVLAISPIFLFQFGEDMKVDLVLLFFGGLVLLLLKHWWYQKEKSGYTLPVLIGVFTGVLLGIKFTTLIFAFFVFFVLLYKVGKKFLAASGLAVFMLILLLGNVFVFSGIEIPSESLPWLYLLFSTLALVSFIWALVQKKIAWARFTQIMVVAAVAFAMLLPWLTFQGSSFIASGESIPSFQGLLMGRPSNPTLQKVQEVTEAAMLSEKDKALLNDLEKVGGSVHEELGRYQGFERGIFHFLSLPFDTTFGRNVSGDYVTIGWVYTALFGVVLAAGFRPRSKSKKRNSLIALLAIIFLYLILRGFAGLSSIESEMTNLLQEYPQALLIVQVVLLLAVAGICMAVWKTDDMEDSDEFIHVLLYGTIVYGVWWTLLASGVVWYGILGMMSLLGLATFFFRRIEQSQVKHIIIYSILLLWILPMSLYRLSMTSTTTLQLVEDARGLVLAPETITSLDQRQFVLYKAGILNEDEGFEYMNQEYYAAQKIINANPDSKVYRIGTLLPYFIEKNNERILTDNQLDVFFDHYMPHKNKDAWTDALKSAGFDYIVFDANTASIDQTKEQTLRRKVELFREYVENNERIRQIPLVKTGGSVYLYEVL